MLRITYLKQANAGPIIKLEGKLLGPWVDEVLQACETASFHSQRPRLDLSSLSFVDAAGICLLRKLLDQNIAVVASSSYVAELLHGGNP